MKYEQHTVYQANFSFSALIEEMKANEQNGKENVNAEAIALLENLEERLANKEADWKSCNRCAGFDYIVQTVFPSFFFKGQLGFVTAPFNKKEFSYETLEMTQLLQTDRWEVKAEAHKLKHSKMHHVLLAGSMVLNTFYDQDVDVHFSEGMTLRDRTTKMQKHYKFNIVLDYVKIKPLKPLKKLSKKQIQELLNNLEDVELWSKYIPPENFLFNGFVIGYLSDVTDVEILSTIKAMMADEGGKSDHEDNLQQLEILVQSYLKMPDIRLGILQIENNPWLENTSWSLLRSYQQEIMQPSFKDEKGSYGKLIATGEAVIQEDLAKRTHLSPLEEALKDKGVRSLLLAPMFNQEGELISVFELGSSKTYRFNRLKLMQLRELISLFSLGSNRFIQEMSNSIRLTMQQEFTAIHPSVEWRFREVATKYYWEQVVGEKQSSLEEIVFKDVYPIYGQADIVGSSNLRNKSIEADMIDNLRRLHELIIACRERVSFDLLDIYQDKVEVFLTRLEKGEFVSSDESLIVELLTREVHPLIQSIKKRFKELPHQQIEDYFAYLDQGLGIVYRRRKDYEESVSLLNQTISYYLWQEEERMQEILPHFFEKFETDGVEYNLYLGQSILEKGSFDQFFLRDFRLWQLLMMCEVTRLVEREAKSFPVPLTTAQLIFVYNNPLSIRFHMDEKQFDVDGAYNVRYEILKKRIDKAYVKGTDERLTQAGKIAIVWLQEKDRQEYMEYLEHLVQRGYIKPEIEDLELERMQGVEGLKALRVEVTIPS